MNFSLDQSWGIESVSQNFKEDDGKTRMGSWHKRRRDLPIWEKQITVDDQDPTILYSLMIQSELKKKMNLLSWNRHSLKITIYSSNSKQVIQSLENVFFLIRGSWYRFCRALCLPNDVFFWTDSTLHILRLLFSQDQTIFLFGYWCSMYVCGSNYNFPPCKLLHSISLWKWHCH